MRILFIFIDGLGIGLPATSSNPCAQPGFRLFNNFSCDPFPKSLPQDGLVKPIDCLLDVPGMPQSATGQAALYTGKHAARLLGKHLSGFPNQKLRQLLAADSILKKLTSLKKRAVFINAYRPIFFEKGPESLIRFLSVTSIMNWQAGLKFYNFQDLTAEKCIYHDFTNRELIRKGFDLPVFTPEKAGCILARASRDFDFLLYEYFKTDHAGHKQNMSVAIDLLKQLEKFIFTVLENIDLSETLIIISSDHGNIEDISLKTHTRNPVPLMVWGKMKHEFLNQVESILNITPLMLKLLS